MTENVGRVAVRSPSGEWVVLWEAVCGCGARFRHDDRDTAVALRFDHVWESMDDLADDIDAGRLR